MRHKKAACNEAALHQSLVALGKSNNSTAIQPSKFGWNVFCDGELIASFLTHRQAVAFTQP